MSTEQKPFTSVNVKVEQHESTCANKMSSFDEKLKLLEIDGKDQIQLLTNFINDDSLSNIQRKKYRQQRILINYKNKKYQDVLYDTGILENTEKLSGLYLILKLKCAIHEQCRIARMCLMNRINDGDNSEDYESLFFNIRPEKAEQFMQGQSTTEPDTIMKYNKRKKVEN